MRHEAWMRRHEPWTRARARMTTMRILNRFEAAARNHRYSVIESRPHSAAPTQAPDLPTARLDPPQWESKQAKHHSGRANRPARSRYLYPPISAVRHRERPFSAPSQMQSPRLSSSSPSTGAVLEAGEAVGQRTHRGRFATRRERRAADVYRAAASCLFVARLLRRYLIRRIGRTHRNLLTAPGRFSGAASHEQRVFDKSVFSATRSRRVTHAAKVEPRRWTSPAPPAHQSVRPYVRRQHQREGPAKATTAALPLLQDAEPPLAMGSGTRVSKTGARELKMLKMELEAVRQSSNWNASQGNGALRQPRAGRHACFANGNLGALDW